MKTLPLVSVIIATFNRKERLLEAVESVVQQTYKNIEIIVVDDCSKDRNYSFLENYNINLHYNQKNIGLAASRNVGIDICSGDYVSFLDDDDTLLPTKVEQQVGILLSDKDVGVVYSGVIRKYKDYKVYKYPSLSGCIYPEILKGCPGPVHSLMIRRECFHEVGYFDEKLQQFEDFDLWVRLSRKYKFGFVNECLVVYNYHSSQMTKNYKEIIISRENIFKKYSHDYALNKKMYYIQLRRQISLCAIYSDYELFYHYVFKAVKLFPFGSAVYAHLILSLFSKKIHKKIICYYGNKKLSPGMTMFLL